VSDWLTRGSTVAVCRVESGGVAGGVRGCDGCARGSERHRLGRGQVQPTPASAGHPQSTRGQRGVAADCQRSHGRRHHRLHGTRYDTRYDTIRAAIHWVK